MSKTPSKRAVTLILLASASACASTEAPPPRSPNRQHGAAPTAIDSTEIPSAGDVTGTVKPSMSDGEIAELRAEGPAALVKLLDQYDSMPVGAGRDALGATIDKVAAQRYATVSRMFWYTDLEQAKKGAAASGKPILSLRMLGRLDEDLSCANSRFFRVVLYANASLSQWLRDSFVLHWSSEREVPRLTIDFGDGRKLERTITGNSVHYVLDAEGRPIDALPGLYAPSVFRRELEDSLSLLDQLEDKAVSERQDTIAEHHRARLAARLEEWKGMGAIEVPMYSGDRLTLPSRATLGQMRTITKSAREMPSLRVVDLGDNPGELPDDPAAWAQIGLRLFPEAMEGAAAKRAIEDAAANPNPNGSPGQIALVGEGYYARSYRVDVSPTPVKIPAILDDQSRALIQAMAPRRWNAQLQVYSYVDLNETAGDDVDRIIAGFEREVVADTAKSEFDVRQGVRLMFVTYYQPDFAVMNQMIYAQTFATPASDPWLGLAPSGFMALPHDGVIQPAP
jgi:hypothetical protein